MTTPITGNSNRPKVDVSDKEEKPYIILDNMVRELREELSKNVTPGETHSARYGEFLHIFKKYEKLQAKIHETNNIKTTTDERINMLTEKFQKNVVPDDTIETRKKAAEKALQYDENLEKLIMNTFIMSWQQQMFNLGSSATFDNEEWGIADNQYE